jgi:excisionase family DNA binding protein
MKNPLKSKEKYNSGLSNPRSLSRFLDKRELAQYLGISLYTVDAWVSQKRIPFVKIGGRKVVFDRNEIEKWIDEQRVENGLCKFFCVNFN